MSGIACGFLVRKNIVIFLERFAIRARINEELAKSNFDFFL